MGLQQGLDAIALIHQAFEQGYQGELQKQKQKTDKEQRDTELKQHQQSSDLAAKMGQAQIEHMQKQLEMEHAQQTFERHKGVLDLLKTGGIKPNLQQDQIPGGPVTDAMGNDVPNVAPITRGPVTMGDTTVQGNEYQLPEDTNQQQVQALQTLGPAQAKQAALQAGAVSQAQLPAEVAKISAESGAKKQEIAATGDIQKTIEATRQEGENNRARLNASATLAGHNIQANATIYAAKLNNFMDPEQQKALAPMATGIFSGVEKVPAGKLGEHAVMIGHKAGYITPDPKAMDALKMVPTIAETVKMIKEFNADFGSNSDVKAYLNNKVALADLPTDIRERISEINTRAIGTGQGLENMPSGRVTNSQINMLKGGLVGPGMDSSQQSSLVGNLENLLQDSVNKNLSGFKPDQKQMIIEGKGLGRIVDNNGNLRPNATAPVSSALRQLLTKAPKTNKLGQPLDRDSTIEQTVRTGKFTPVYN